MAKRKSKEHEKLDRPVKHENPPLQLKIFIGEKYYRRLQPTPFQKTDYELQLRNFIPGL